MRIYDIYMKNWTSKF